MFILDRTVVGIDFSESSERAARYLADCLAPHSRLDLVHVLDARRAATLVRSDEVVATLEQAARDHLCEVATRFDPARPGTILVLEDDPAEALLVTARQIEADLIAVGDHGHRGGAGHIVGSVPERLAREAAGPVLVVRDAPLGPPRNILVAVSDSPEADEVVAWARYLAEMHEARLHLIHVESSWYADQLRLFLNERHAEELEAAQRERASVWMERLVLRAGLEATNFELLVRSGQPGVELLRAEAEFESDLTICGLRAEGRVRPFLGSIARFVLQQGRSNLLVVPRLAAPQKDRTASDTISGVGDELL